MNKDFKRQFETYSKKIDSEITLSYFEKYWLDTLEYQTRWHSIHKELFWLDKIFPEMVFMENLEITITFGGLLFIQEDFERLKSCLKETGDEYFVIIQHFNQNDPPQFYHIGEGWKTSPVLRFRFPVEITWDELLSGGGISEELFKTPLREYHIFGDSGLWGKYAANDYDDPLDIYGFSDKYDDVFKSSFKTPDDMKKQLIAAAPEKYKIYI